MNNKIKHRLNETNSVNSVNINSNLKIGLEQSNRPLPVGELNRVLNVADRFNHERQNSTIYRIIGTISTLFTNVLFNTTGNNSLGYFLTNTLFRDKSYPQNGVNYIEGDLNYREALKENLIEKDGWFGYYDPNTFSKSLCLFYDMEPNRTLFDLAPKNRIKNWEITLTYPALSANTFMTQGGLLVVENQIVNVNNRSMVAFATPTKHGLNQGDTVRISGLSNPTLDGDYPVIRLGLDNGDLIEYYFVIDINGVNITNNTRIKRMVGDEETIYYWRKFKKLITINGNEIMSGDYSIYPLNFSKTLYNDTNIQFVIHEDIDIGGLRDNLNRPISEIFLTIIKTDSDQGDGSGPIFTPIQSGIEIPFINGVSSFINSVPDIKRIHNGTTPSPHTPLDNSVSITDSEFYGDIVSYNRLEVKEMVLGEVRHRFNTYNRENGGIVIDPEGLEPNVNMGNRYEGYYYKPHHRIKIREYSNYIEQGDVSTSGIPDYAEDLGDGRWLWRDLLDIGFSDVSATPIDYPFLNGCHYIHKNFCLPLRRQDPFGKYGLYYGTFPRDPIGEFMVDNFEVKKSQNVC